MAQIHFNVDDLTYLNFKNEVGEGNVSIILRNFVEGYAKTKTKTKNFKDELDQAEKEYNKAKKKFDLVLFKIKQEEDKQKKFKEEQMERFKKAEGNAMKSHLHRVV